MNLNQSRGALLVIFLVFLLAQIAMIYGLGLANRIFVDEAVALITQVLAIYSVHLAVILGGMFAVKKTGMPSATPLLSWSAIGLSLMWNALLLGGTISFAVSNVWKLHDIRNYLETVSRSSSFLVAGALAFFFASPAGRAERSGKRNPAGRLRSDES
jgi:hypothetical protein